MVNLFAGKLDSQELKRKFCKSIKKQIAKWFDQKITGREERRIYLIKRNKNKPCCIDVNRADAFVLLSSLYRVAQWLKKGKQTKRNRNSDRVYTIIYTIYAIQFVRKYTREWESLQFNKLYRSYSVYSFFLIN